MSANKSVRAAAVAAVLAAAAVASAVQKQKQEEKEYKSLRRQIQEKLIKFATRVPIFMYLTDYRERSLKDVITKLEPGLFKKVTGLRGGSGVVRTAAKMSSRCPSRRSPSVR